MLPSTTRTATCLLYTSFDDKIDTPAVYFGKQNKGVWKSKEEFPNPYNWSGYIVGQISVSYTHLDVYKRQVEKHDTVQADKLF